jgi:hypothetical protein
LLLLTLQALAQAQGRPASHPVTHNPHGNITIPCENCHTFTSWKPIRRVPEFDHNKTSYPLRGMHEKVDCVQCHTKLVFTDVSTNCAGCHADIHRRQFGANCEQCHTVRGWNVTVQAIQNHQNRFPLLGAHAAVDCDSCHKGAATGQFQGLSTQCYSCHAQDFQSATNPNHVAASFPTTCEQCHGMNTWLDAKFDHSLTGFLLTGAHTTTPCLSCHVNGNYKLTDTSCASCHLKDFQSTTNPNHTQAVFPQTCQTCHNTTAWAPAPGFNHNMVSSFPLTGAHISVPCSSCHLNGQFAGEPTDCVGCHLKDFQGTTNPNHVTGGLPTTCQTCHTTTAWQPATFDHSKTAFPLTGAHATAACAACHVNNNYTNLSTDCASCHINDFNATTNPNHTQSGIPTTCQVCHTTTAWQPATFDHSKTGFALTGAHVNVACSSCHINNNYSLTDTTCVSCHLKDFQGTTNPNHIAGGLPTTCQTCHTTTAWQPATFDHNTTGFALTGAHVNVACSSCHINNNYSLTSSACSTCHLTDYQSTNNPNHAAAGFPTDCTLCHTTISWTGATFNHATTGFPLTGAHLNVACSSCHVNNNYSLTNTTCVSCHLKDFQGTTNPNHVAAGFPQQCELCHTTTAWQPSSFNHNNTPFPLTGAHTTVACASCHVNNNYTSVPTDCYSCHKTDYQSTTNPNHQAAGFPTTCQTCHTTTTWSGATFSHTWFPTNHGNAQGVCATCHTNSSDYSIFQCTGCHTASTTNPRHTGVSGYVYNSINCYQCHPRGTGG